MLFKDKRMNVAGLEIVNNFMRFAADFGPFCLPAAHFWTFLPSGRTPPLFNEIYKS